jgi:uncharacterized DUF497 family protein
VSSEWDEPKRRRNLAKHAVDFIDAAEIFFGPTAETQDRRRDYGEARFQTLGRVRERVLYVVYTWRNGRRRIISARRASSDEVTIYETIAGPNE